MARNKIYDTARWQKLRRIKLQTQPTCEVCRTLGQTYPADVVDHKIPINHGGDPFPPLSGLTSLCTCHHNMKTRAEQIGKPFIATPVIPLDDRGCDEHGNPFNQASHWYR